MDEPVPTKRRGWWIGLAAALAAFLAIAVGLTMSAAGPGPNLAASSAPRPDRTLSPDATDAGCPTAPRTSCVDIAIVESPLTGAQADAVRPQADAILRAVSTIDWCATPQHSPCSGATRSLVAADVAVVRSALARAGFTTADVTLVDPAMIRYVVPLPPACVLGYVLGVQTPPYAPLPYRARGDGRCTPG